MTENAMMGIRRKVAKQIMDHNELKRSKEGKKGRLLLKMRDDFKLEMSRHAAMEGRSMTNYILTAVAHRMEWTGEL